MEQRLPTGRRNKKTVKGKNKMADKIYRKKLTNSGGGICFTTGLAAVFACCAAAGDFLAAAIYGQFYTKQLYPMHADFVGFTRYYGSAAVTAVFAVIMFIWALSAAKGKRLGREFGMMGIFMGAAFCLLPAEQIYSLMMSDFTDAYFRTGYDSDVFQGVVELARHGLPIISGLMLFFTGIAALARLGGDDFAVEAPGAAKRSVQTRNAARSKSEDGEFADPHSFGGGKTVEQGLTGETKPATYNEPSEDEPAEKESSEKEEKPAKKATVKLCFKCGELVGEDELFCANCGQKM